MTADDPATAIAALFASEGAAEYLGEPVTQAEHMLQAAALAERDHAARSLVAAALLHDVGHFAGALTGNDLMRGTDNRHEQNGAAWLGRWFGEEVTEPIRLRRWDDMAKDPGVRAPGFDHYAGTLRALAR